MMIISVHKLGFSESGSWLEREVFFPYGYNAAKSSKSSDKKPYVSIEEGYDKGFFGDDWDSPITPDNGLDGNQDATPLGSGTVILLSLGIVYLLHLKKKRIFIKNNEKLLE